MFEQVLNDNYAEVKRLLRRRNVIGDVSPATIEKAFQKHGEKFMMELLEIITPNDSNFSGLFLPLSSEAINYAQGNSVVPELELEKAVKEGGKFWSFWDNLLNRVDNTGQTIGNFKINSSGFNQQPYNQAAQYPAQTFNPRLIYAAAGFLVVVVVLLLIFKN